MLVFIAEIAIKTPKKYAPPSPRNTFPFGKLNIRKFINVNIPKIKIELNHYSHLNN